jgi:hypothetical protein
VDVNSEQQSTDGEEWWNGALLFALLSIDFLGEALAGLRASMQFVENFSKADSEKPVDAPVGAQAIFR